MSAPRLYLVTPPLTAEADFAPTLESALAEAPVACVRLRMAEDDEAALRRVAGTLREIAHAADVALVLTDHFRLVGPLGLDGAHLADPRLSVREARKALGADAILGAFAGASRHRGMNAAEAGADYIAFGPVAAGGLGDGSVAEVGLFAWWAEMIETPVVAEGGLTLEAAPELAAHADFLAPSASVWRHRQGPAAGAAAYAAILERGGQD